MRRDLLEGLDLSISRARWSQSASAAIDIKDCKLNSGVYHGNSAAFDQTIDIIRSDSGGNYRNERHSV